MRFGRYSYVLMTLFALCSCNGGVEQKRIPEKNNIEDTLLLLESDSGKVFYKDGLYANADNSFYDFIYLFKSDSVFQRERISFPVRNIQENGNVEYIDSSKWHFDTEMLDNIYYTQFFNKEQDIDDSADICDSSISLKEFYLDKELIRSYNFAKDENGRWMLESIEMKKGDSDDFIYFYARFVSDSVFQNEHLSGNIKFVTYDPADDLSIMEADISSDQWNAFKPVMNTDVISEFDCHHSDTKSNIIIASTVQIDAGYNVRLHFRKNLRKGWLLYKYEDLSN